MASSRTRTPVLILARDPVLAALVGLALGLGDIDPLFAAPGERPDDAIARLQPRLVVLLDGTLDEADSDLFYARAARRGARLVLFAVPGEEGTARAAAIASARGIPFVDVPTSEVALHAALHAALEATAHAPATGGDGAAAGPGAD